MNADGPLFIAETRETLCPDSPEELYRSRVPQSCAVSRGHLCDVDSFRCRAANGKRFKGGPTICPTPSKAAPGVDGRSLTRWVNSPDGNLRN